MPTSFSGFSSDVDSGLITSPLTRYTISSKLPRLPATTWNASTAAGWNLVGALSASVDFTDDEAPAMMKSLAEQLPLFELTSATVRVCDKPQSNNADSSAAKAEEAAEVPHYLSVSGSVDCGVRSLPNTKLNVALSRDNPEVTVTHTIDDPAVSARLDVKLFEGFVSKLDVSGNVTDNVVAGAFVHYDPLRSGVKDCGYGVLFTQQAFLSKHLPKFDGYLTHTALQRGVTVGLSCDPGTPYVTAFVKADSMGKTLLAGLRCNSPCGAKVCSRYDFFKNKLALSATKSKFDWDLKLVTEFDCAGSWKPTVGISLSASS